MSDAPSCRVSDAEQAVVVLREHLLEGRLTLEEFSDRTGQALRAVARGDLAELQTDLPRGILPSASRRRPTRIVAGVFAHVVRRGRLRLRRRTFVLSVLPDIDLDLREASIEAPCTSVSVVALVGNVDVYVPEGIDIDVRGMTMIGHMRDWGEDVILPDAPRMRVRVLGLVGTVDVWRVPQNMTGTYASITDQLQAARRRTELPEPVSPPAVRVPEQMELWRRLVAIDGVAESPSTFSERTALFVNGREIAHEDADGRYDVRLTRQVIRQMRDRLRAEPCVRLRQSSSSDWIDVAVTDGASEELLVELVTAAADAHRPPSGTTLRPPPEGEELARRRRFH